MSNPTITIITVAHNAVEALSVTIDRITKLTYKPLEYFVIDGGSDDGTVELLNNSAAVVTKWISEPDSGIYDAMNKGWEMAQPGSYILFIGAGDCVESLPENMEQYKYNDVLCGLVDMGKGRIFKPNPGIHLRIYNSIHHQALLVNKQIFPKPPFRDDCGVYADFDFNQRLLKLGANFVFCPEFGCYAHPGGESDRASFFDTLPVIRRNFGSCWVLVAVAAYLLSRCLPVLLRLTSLSRSVK